MANTTKQPNPAPGALAAGGQKIRRRVAEGWRRLLYLDWLWVALLVVVGGWVLLPDGSSLSQQVEAGEIATRDYTAPRDDLVLDEELTQGKRQREQEAVLPVYDLDTAAALNHEEQLTRLFSSGRLFLEDLRESVQPGRLQEGEIEEALLSAVGAATSLKLAPETARLLKAREFAADLEDRLRALVQSLLRTGVVANKTVLLENRLHGVTLRNLQTLEERLQFDLFGYRGHPDEVQRVLETEIGQWPGWAPAQRRVLVAFLVANISPNVSLNLSETTIRREAAATAVEPVYSKVLKGQVMARSGDTISTAAARAINTVMVRDNSWGSWVQALGNIVLLGLVALGLWHGLKRTRLAEGHVDGSTFGGLLLLLVLALVATQVALSVGDAFAASFDSGPFNSQRAYRYAVPYAGLALVVSLVYGRGAALLVALCFSVLAGRLDAEDPMATSIFVIAGSLAAIYALDRLKQRVAVTRAGLLVGLTGMVAAVMLATFDDSLLEAPMTVGYHALCALIGGILVAAATGFTVPVVESLLGATTDIKLIELSDTNLPLLRRVAFEAPGTFQHSLMVANLAKEGCEAIGANPVLAYTGGLYHDIGKVIRPAYFVENLRDGENRHDRLAPSMSSLIVISHVRDGVDLARQHRLPQPILDAIEQHHGTRKLSFFYDRAREQSRGEPVDEHKYRYPGPKPQNKVMGVLMFADAVEAASRTLREPNAATIRGLVKRLIDDCVHDDQLDETDLTLADLRRVSEAFERVLLTIYHKRIDYPGYDFNVTRRDRLRVVESSG